MPIDPRLLLRLIAIASLSSSLFEPAVAEVDRVVSFRATYENQLGLTFTSDGSRAFWVEWNGKWGARNTSRKVIMTSTLSGDSWAKPSAFLSSKDHSNDDPFVSPDGEWLYFVSDRPTSETDTDPDSNIWRLRIVGQTHAEYVEVNSPGEEWSPVITETGQLFFASDRKDGIGQGDIYCAEPAGDSFLSPAPLGPAINSVHGEWNLWVSPQGDEIVFEASGRARNVTVPGDLYYSWKSSSGWTPAIPIPNINTTGSDLMPRVHPTSDRLIFTRADAGGTARLVATRWSGARAAARKDFKAILAVANRSSHEVTLIDLEEGKVTARLATGEGPHLLSNVVDGRMLATGYGVFPKPHLNPVESRPPFVERLNSRATLIDVERREVVREFVVPQCARPHASWLLEGYAYVTCEDEKFVRKLDLRDGAVVSSLSTAQGGSHVLGADRTGRWLAVSNTESGSVSLFDLQENRTRVIGTADGAEGLAFVRGRLWVANALDRSVSVIDPESGKVETQIDDVCGFPISVSRGSGNLVWIACFSSAELVGIGLESKSVEKRIRLEANPLHVLVHPTRNLAYVSLPRRNAIAELDLDSGQVIRTIEVGIEPDGLRWIVLHDSEL